MPGKTNLVGEVSTKRVAYMVSVKTCLLNTGIRGDSDTVELRHAGDVLAAETISGRRIIPLCKCDRWLLG